MNPYAILASFAVFVLCVAGAYVGGRRDGSQIAEAKYQAAENAAQKSREAADKAIAEGLAKLEPKTVTIRQKTERIIEKVPVLTECVAPDSLRAVTDAALAGTDPPADSELPGTQPPARSDIR